MNHFPRPLALLITLAAGCSTILPDLPKTGAAANGQPLSLREDLVRETEDYKKKVATVRDDEGHTLADVYEEGTRIKEIPVWYGYQGKEYVDAEDFFRIAGDADNEGNVRRARKLAYVANRGGWIAAVTGVALIIVTSTLPQTTPGRTGIFLGGLLGFGAGTPIAIWGATHLSPERHDVPSSSAAMDAAQYNQHLHDSGEEHAKAVRVGWSF